MPPPARTLPLLAAAAAALHPGYPSTSFCHGLQFPQLPSFLGRPPWDFQPPSSSSSSSSSSSLSGLESDLLAAVSGTENGRAADPNRQAKVLRLVGQIERLRPPPTNLLSDPAMATRLDGTWYLQYTSPSEIGGEDLLGSEGEAGAKGEREEEAGTWTPVDPVEVGVDGRAIETNKFQARGSISAVGVTVDTSRRTVRQIFDVGLGVVSNVIDLGWGTLTVRGPFRPSSKVGNRAVVAFRDLTIEPGGGEERGGGSLPVLRLGWVFAAIAAVKGSDVGGWLETTYLGDDMRIGRGNKGTMFVLTRDAGAVEP